MRDLLKDKVLVLLVHAVMLVTAGITLHLLGVGGYAVFFVLFILTLPLCAKLAVDAARRYSYYRRVRELFDGLERRSLLSEMLDEPPFADAAFWQEILRGCNKSENDEIEAVRGRQREYREYIETWVHEIKTPIAAMDLHLQNGAPVRDEVARNLRDIDGYVEQALYYTRSDAPEKDYAIKEVDLETVAGEALKKNAPLLIAAGAEIKRELAGFTAYTDSKWLVFMLSQLFQNAVRYRGEGKPLQLTLTAQERTGGVALTIRDEGVGIASEDLPRVFEKGFTGQNGRQFGRSTGIGLYLCKRLCEKLGMGIEIDSEKGGYTAVELWLPGTDFYRPV